jgi:hypothetical protein
LGFLKLSKILFEILDWSFILWEIQICWADLRSILKFDFQ